MSLFDASAVSLNATMPLGFPQSLSEKYRPQRIADFIGLDKPKRIASKLVAAPFSSAWGFLGSSGTGKTTLALAIANELPAELHHIPSQECTLENIQRARRTCQYVPRLGCPFHLVLVDEADQMSTAAQVAQLSILDATNFPPNTRVSQPEHVASASFLTSTRNLIPPGRSFQAINLRPSSLSQARILRAVESGDMMGFCKACGAEVDGAVSPAA